MEIMHQLLLWDTQEQSGYNDSASSFERCWQPCEPVPKAALIRGAAGSKHCSSFIAWNGHPR
eukprot:12891441-Prorocentrum_lima.AAC.1